MGDLIVTCTSRFSRNWQAGYTIGSNDDAEVFWKTNTKTVEGVEACRIICIEVLPERRAAAIKSLFLSASV